MRGMPHQPHGDEQGPKDEVKVFKHEEDDEEILGTEDLSVEDRLTEDKSSLITESETKASNGSPPNRTECSSAFGPVVGRPFDALAERHALGYYYSPYSPYASNLQSLTGKMGLPHFLYGSDPLAQPPPAHMGIPPYQFDTKGMPRPFYPFAASGAYPAHHPHISATDLSWGSTPLYPSTSAAFRSPYPDLASLHRFSPGLLPPPPSLPSHLVQSEHLRQRSLAMQSVVSSRSGSTSGSKSTNSSSSSPSLSSSSHHHLSSVNSSQSSREFDKKKSHIKKPLNAFMLYMKEMRAQVVAECTLKESAAINQILGRRWHALNKEEQSRYYDMARRERQNHLQMYPGWSARDNYAQSKKKKRKRDRIDAAQMKKCRARYGLEQQDQWCKPCRRKKKCIRYMEAMQAASGENGGPDSCGSGDAGVPSGQHHDRHFHDIDDDDYMDDDDDEDIDDEDDGVGSSDAVTPGSVESVCEERTRINGGGGMTGGSCSSVAASVGSPGYSVASLLSPSPMVPSPLTPSSTAGSVGGVSSMLCSASGSTEIIAPRTPIGANPRDSNNPLSVDQLTNSSPRPPHSAARAPLTVT